MDMIVVKLTKELKREFKIKTIKEDKSMSEVLMEFIKNYTKE